MGEACVSTFNFLRTGRWAADVLFPGILGVSISLIRSASCFATLARALSLDFRAASSAAAFLPRDFLETGVVALRFGPAVLRAWVFGFLRTGRSTTAVLLRGFLETGVGLPLGSRRAIFLIGVFAFGCFAARLTGAILRRGFLGIEFLLIRWSGRADFVARDSSLGFFRWIERLTFAVLPAGFFEGGIFFAFRPALFALVGARMTRLANGRFGDSLIDGNGLCTTCTAILPVFSTTSAKGGVIGGGHFIETFCSTAACSNCKASCREL